MIVLVLSMIAVVIAMMVLVAAAIATAERHDPALNEVLEIVHRDRTSGFRVLRRGPYDQDVGGYTWS